MCNLNHFIPNKKKGFQLLQCVNSIYLLSALAFINIPDVVDILIS